jgi:hypothetical protein
MSEPEGCTAAVTKRGSVDFVSRKNEAPGRAKFRLSRS